jgi:hypothetical protein
LTFAGPVVIPRDPAYSLRLARGSHTIRVAAIDRAGNRSAAARTCHVG